MYLTAARTANAQTHLTTVASTDYDKGNGEHDDDDDRRGKRGGRRNDERSERYN